MNVCVCVVSMSVCVFVWSVCVCVFNCVCDVDSSIDDLFVSVSFDMIDIVLNYSLK